MQFSSRFPLALLVLGLPVFAETVPGIHNFGRVDERLYRGGQPTPAGIEYLAKLGVRTVIDLREPGARSRAERRLVTASGMKYMAVPMSGFTAPAIADITKILATLEDPAAGPVFIHCRRGADRTGAVVAAYHIAHDNWDNARALKDARAHHMSFYQFPRANFIRNFRPQPAEPVKALQPQPAEAVVAPTAVR